MSGEREFRMPLPETVYGAAFTTPDFRALIHSLAESRVNLQLGSFNPAIFLQEGQRRCARQVPCVPWPSDDEAPAA